MSENKTTASGAPAAPENVSKAGAPPALDTSARDAKDGGPTVEELAEEASVLEKAVLAEAKRNNWKSCSHVFGEPFYFQGLTFERLDFDWARLTGRDSLSIEEEILIRKRKTVVDAKYSTDYLCGMAVRACTSQSAEGGRRAVHHVKFLLENVIMKKEWRNIISDTLGVQPLEINSRLVSAQNRPRQYWTNIEGVTIPKDRGVVLRDILEDPPLETVEKHGVKFATNIGPGIYRPQMDLVSVVDGEVRIKQATKLGYIVARPGDGVNIQFPTSYNRRGRVIEGKSSTLDTNCEVCVYTGDVIRQFTMTELERLQTLPDGYTEAESVTEAARRKAIGSGWTTEVIVHIFDRLQLMEELMDF